MLLLLACVRGPSEPPAPATLLPLPTPSGAQTPALVEDGEDLLLTWQQSSEEGGSLHFSRFTSAGWSAPIELVSDAAMLVNWADFPSAVRGGDGALYTHWLRREEGGPYAYDVEVLRSEDGETWAALGTLNSDEEAAEHGFVSWVPTETGARATWLDGRDMAAGEPMSLRAAEVDTSVHDEVVVDARVCDCCRTDAAGELVVYRDRSPTEVRDIWVARPLEERWAKAPLSTDSWQIAGCPVNGPDLEKEGDLAVTAWFTGADEQLRVRLAFAADGWMFGEPIEVAPGVGEAPPKGRVAVALDGDEAIAFWLASASEDEGVVLARRVAANGDVGPLFEVGRTAAGRASGFPSVAWHAGRLVVAWTVPDAGIESLLVDPNEIGVVEGPLDVAPTETAGPPQALPEFDLVDLAGEPLVLPEDGVLLALWATWCGPCRKELPELQALYEAGVPVVGVSVDDADQGARVAAFVEDLELGFPVAHDYGMAARFNTNAIPATYLFDAEGQLVWHRIEAFDAEDPTLIEALAGLSAD